MQAATFFTGLFSALKPRNALALAVLGTILSAMLAGCGGPPAPRKQTVSLEPAATSRTTTQAGAQTNAAPNAYPNSFPDNFPNAGTNPYAGTFDSYHPPAPLGSPIIDTPPRPAGAITITLLLPMSSPIENVRALANTLLQAAQLALFDVARPELLLRVQDTSGTPVGAQTAARAALAASTDLIIGPLFATSVQAIAPVLAGSRVPALAFSNDRSVAHRNIWLLGFIPEDNIDRAIAQTIGQGLARFGALLPEGAYGERLGRTLDERITHYGGELVQVEVYPPDAPGMFEPVKRLAHYETRRAAHGAEVARLEAEAALLAPPDTASDKLFDSIRDIAPELVSNYETLKRVETLGEIPYDAVFMPEGGLALRNLAPLLPYFDVDPRLVKFVGTGLWDDPELGQEPPLHGGWYAAPDAGLWRKFSDHYADKFQTRPARLASIAYDAVALAARLAAVHATAPFRPQTLTDPNGFAGIDGILRLTPNGLAERGLAVHEIQRKKTVLISPAPASFVERDRRMQAALALAATLQTQRAGLLQEARGLETRPIEPFSPPAPRP
jgi:hypothetical protein